MGERYLGVLRLIGWISLGVFIAVIASLAAVLSIVGIVG